jgi:hypothetical protein
LATDNDLRTPPPPSSKQPKQKKANERQDRGEAAPENCRASHVDDEEYSPNKEEETRSTLRGKPRSSKRGACPLNSPVTVTRKSIVGESREQIGVHPERRNRPYEAHTNRCRFDDDKREKKRQRQRQRQRQRHTQGETHYCQ